MTSPGTEEVGARLRLAGRQEFQRDADAASRSVRNIGDSADKADAGARRASGGLGTLAKVGIGGLVSAAKIGVGALAGLTVGLVGAGLKTVGLAMDAAETQSKFSTVFAGMEDDVGSFVATMNADFGIPTKELQDAASTFGVFAKAAGVPRGELAGFSKDLLSAGSDLASFYNVEPGEAFQALKSGLAGEAEPLRAFGIFLSDATMKAEAASMGLTGELTESQKVMVRHRIIMKSLGDAQGDLARTSGGLSNQWKALKGRLTEAGTAIGTALLPLALRLVTALNDRLAPIVNTLSQQVPNLIAAFQDNDLEGVAEVLDNIAGNSGELKWRFLELLSAGESLFYAFQYGGLADAAGEFDRLSGGSTNLAGALAEAKSVGADIATVFTDLLLPAIGDLTSAIDPAWLTPLGAARLLLGFVADNAETLQPLVVGLAAGYVAWNAALMIHRGVMAITGALMAARVGITMLLTGTTGLATAAELTRNQALLASIALHARLGAMMVWTGIKAVGSMLLTVATTVGGWIVMGVTAMANAVIMAAAWFIALGPVGWAIGLLVLIGAAFVVLWKKSETFRNIVKGALSAVGSAAVAAKDWIVNAFNVTVNFLSGLPRRISAATSGMWDGIKNTFRSAINWIIDKWNGLEFGVPPISVMGKEVFGGATIGTPNIPRLHQGGTTTTGGAAIIQPGEELVVLPPAASVVPLDDRPAVEAVTGGGSREPIVLQVVMDRRVLAEAVYDHTGDKVARR